MVPSFQLRKSHVPTPGLCLSIVGAMLTLIGFFLPLVFVQGVGERTISSQMSQWSVIQIYSMFISAWHLIPVLALPLLTALFGLVISIITVIQGQFYPRQARLMYSIAAGGAFFELLLGPFLYFISGILGAKIFLGSGLVLLVLGSIIQLVGFLLEYKRQSAKHK